MPEASLRYKDAAGIERVVRLAEGPVVSVGSSPGNRVTLEGPNVLPAHLQLWHEQSGWSFQAATDAAEVRVNGEPQSHGRLNPGDQIQVGPFLLLFEGGAGALISPQDVGIDDSTSLASLLPGGDAPRKTQPVDFADLDSGPGVFGGSEQDEKPDPVDDSGPELMKPPDSLGLEDKSEILLEPTTEESTEPETGSLELEGPAPGVPGLGNLGFASGQEETLDDPFEPSGAGPPARQDEPDTDVNTSRIRFTDSQQEEPQTIQTGWQFKEAGPSPAQPPQPPAVNLDGETAEESAVRLVSDDASDEEFVSLGGQGTVSAERPRHRVIQRQRKQETQNLAATFTVSALMLALLVFFAYVLLKEPEKVEESPIFNELVEAFIKEQDDEVRKLEQEFWDRPATPTQQARVKEILTVMEIRGLAAAVDHEEVIKRGQPYLASDPHYEFAVIPLMQASFLSLADRRKDSGDIEGAESYLNRAIRLAPETQSSKQARDRLRAFEQERQTEEIAAEAKGRFDEFLKQAPALLASRAYQQLLDQYQEIAKAYPAAANSEESRTFLEQAARALEEAEAGTVELLAVTGPESHSLLVKPEVLPAAEAIPLTPQLFWIEGRDTKTLSGKDTFAVESPSGEELLVAEGAGAYYGVDPANGRIRWASPKGETRSTPLHVIRPPNSSTQILGYDAAWGHLHLCSSADGKEVWRTRLDGKLSCPPSSDGRRIWLGAEPTDGEGGPKLLVVDTLSGHLLGVCKLPSPLSCAPVPDRVEAGGRTRSLLYVCTRQGYLYVLDAGTGKMLQGFKMRGPVTQPPLKVPPFLLLFQAAKGAGVCTAARVTADGLADRGTWQHLPMTERPVTRPSVDAALVYLSGNKGSVFTFGVEVKRDQDPVYDASRGGQSLGLRSPVYATPTEDGRHVYAAGDSLKSVEFRQFEAETRLTVRWTFEGREGWPRPDRATRAVEARAGAVFLWTGRKGAPGSLLWSIDARTGAPLWCLSLGTGLGCGPAVSPEGRAYLRTCGGRLLALLSKAGRLVVEPRDYDVQRPQEFSRAAAAPVPVDRNGTPVFLFGNHDGLFYAIEQHTGFSAWKKPFATEAPITGAAAVLGEVVYFCSGPDVYGLSIKDGSKKHQFTVEDRSRFLAAPAILDGTVIAGNRNGNIYGLRPATEAGVSFLREEWRYETDGPIRYRAVAAPGLALVGSDDERVYGLTKDGALKRRWTLGGPLAADPVAAEGEVFVAARNGVVLCLSPGTEGPLWQQRLAPGAVPTSLMAAGGALFVATTQGRLLHLSATDGTITGQFQAGRATINGMAAMTDRLLAASADGHLYLLPLTKPE